MTDKINIDSEKIQNIRTELKSQFVERDEQVDGAICALLAKQHLFMVGAPGTAKSLLTDELCNRIEGANYFQWLLTKFSTPEEIFGPISLKGLENDEYTRITKNKIPEAHIAFLDECFKANSAILNALLTLVNERKYHNNGHPINVPLQTLFGASNELPEGEELGALYDRFLLRYVVNYIADDSDFKAMLLSNGTPSVTKITLAELGKFQADVEKVCIPDEMIDLVIKIKTDLRNEGVIPSDRRFKQSLLILKAHAYMNGRDTVNEDDLQILQHIFWSQPAEIKAVQRVIMGTANPILNKVTELSDQAAEIYKGVTDTLANAPDEASGQGVEANAKLKKIGESLSTLKDTSEKDGNSTTHIDAAIKKVTELNKNVLKDCLGLDI